VGKLDTKRSLVNTMLDHEIHSSTCPNATTLHGIKIETKVVGLAAQAIKVACSNCNLR
jgi:hypothetical protein